MLTDLAGGSPAQTLAVRLCTETSVPREGWTAATCAVSLATVVAAVLTGCVSTAPPPPVKSAPSYAKTVARVDSMLALAASPEDSLGSYRSATRVPETPDVSPRRLALGVRTFYTGTTYSLGDSLYIEQEVGGALHASYEVTSEIAVRLTLGGSRIPTADAGIGTIGLRTVDVGVYVDSPGPPTPANGYVLIALTHQTATADVLTDGEPRRLTVRGGGLTIGGGVLLAGSPRLAVGLSVDLQLGTLGVFATESESGSQCFCSRTARFGVGLIYRL